MDSKKRRYVPYVVFHYGKPGFLYALENPDFRPGILKIGLTKTSSRDRAAELTRRGGTALPGAFRSVFEHPTKDRGRAEVAVHRALSAYRVKGPHSREFFAIDLLTARTEIVRACRRVDGLPDESSLEIEAKAALLVEPRIEKPSASSAASPSFGQTAGAHEAQRLRERHESHIFLAEAGGPSYRLLKLLCAVAVFYGLGAIFYVERRALSTFLVSHSHGVLALAVLVLLAYGLAWRKYGR